MTSARAKHCIAVAVSGGGRSLSNLLDQQDHLWRVGAVISSSPDCRAVSIARDHGVPVLCLNFVKMQPQELHSALETFLEAQGAELIVLAGFLKKFPILRSFAGRIINIHPALLPKFGGPGMYGAHVHRAVLSAKEQVSGATVHVVTEHYDDGPILAQITVSVHGNDTPETLADRVFQAECKLLPLCVTKFFENQGRPPKEPL